jgi:Mn2+/Fe2+ NRAMP family transporter
MDSQVSAPPEHLRGILSHLGPGLIIAAAIVGSGELIATTLTGAKAGLSLLWLIVLGCVVKVFTQIEIGRFTVSTGMKTLSALSLVPGPRIRGRGNWLVWYWFFMWFCSIGQLGGIVGGVGQLFALVQPITQQGRDYQEIGALETEIQLSKVTRAHQAESTEDMEKRVANLRLEYVRQYERYPTANAKLPRPIDDRLWAVPVAIITSLLLVFGGYGFIQNASTAMVAVFTLVTLGTVIGMQLNPDWRIPLSEWLGGLSFGLPPGDTKAALATAFATIGIIGVGAAELIQYPYWCIEKGYARKTGPFDGSEGWYRRARGWLRVMQYDIWVSLVIYTAATLGFFVLGAGILHRSGIKPEESKLLQTLSVLYEPILGSWSPPIYLVGAFMVLYSTFYVANASHARTFADGLNLLSIIPGDERSQSRTIRFLSGLFPLLCLTVYWILPQPAWLVLISGTAQAIMLPMLASAALYFRYFKSIRELRGPAWMDVALWISAILMFVIGIASLVTELLKYTR